MHTILNSTRIKIDADWCLFSDKKIKSITDVMYIFTMVKPEKKIN
jgi:hypothetical protein